MPPPATSGRRFEVTWTNLRKITWIIRTTSLRAGTREAARLARDFALTTRTYRDGLLPLQQ
jgi:hypothetical protein